MATSARSRKPPVVVLHLFDQSTDTLLGQAHVKEVARRVRAHLGHQVSGLRSRLVGDCEEGRYAANECTVSSNDVVVIDVAL